MKKYKPYLGRVDLVKNQVAREELKEQEAKRKRSARVQQQNKQRWLKYQEQLRSELAARYFHAVQSTGGESFSNTKSLQFDGIDDYVIANVDGTSTGGVLASADTDVDVTISLWFKIPSIPSTDRGLFQWSNALTSLQPFILFQIRTTGNFRIYVDNGYRFSQPISINTWYNVVFIRTASTNTWTLYFNDSPVATYNDGGVMTYRGNASSIYLGNGYNGYINTLIDEVAIWNSDRTADVTTIYNSGEPGDLNELSNKPYSWYRFEGTGATATDSGTGGNDGTINGATRDTDIPE
jgi:hypothetical protein